MATSVLKLMMAALCIASVCSHIPGSIGPYPTKYDTVHVGGYIAEFGLIQDAIIFYPDTTEEGPFPIVVLAHGMFNGGEGVRSSYSVTMDSVASFGYIVMAPMSCKYLWCEFFDRDVYHTLEVAFENPSLHPALAKADYNSTALMGHSMGGDAVTRVSTWAESVSKYHLKATAGLMPAVEVDPLTSDTEIKVPYFFVAGSADDVISSSRVHTAYEKDPNSYKAFVTYKGADHNDPTNLGHMHQLGFMIQFFECHTKGN